MIVYEASSLLLLVREDPIPYFKDKLRKAAIASDLPPVSKRLHQPRDLSEMPLVTKPVTIVLEAAMDNIEINLRRVLLRQNRQRQQHLPRKIILEKIIVSTGIAVCQDSTMRLSRCCPQCLC